MNFDWENKRYTFIGIVLLCLSIALLSCDGFQFSPYEINLEGDKENLSQKNISQIASQNNLDTSFKIAILADPHREYDDLVRAVKHLNARTDLDFIVVAGDFTKFGLRKEFEWFYDIMSNLNTPYLTVIGNHESVANGPLVYREMFGELNYSFVYKDSRFVFLNSNRWDFEYKVPDFNWLEQELAAGQNQEKLFVIAHIAPFQDQFDSQTERQYRELMAAYQTDLSIHGHSHNFYLGEFYDDGISYLVADDAGADNYVTLTIADTLMVERTYF